MRCQLICVPSFFSHFFQSYSSVTYLPFIPASFRRHLQSLLFTVGFCEWLYVRCFFLPLFVPVDWPSLLIDLSFLVWMNIRVTIQYPIYGSMESTHLAVCDPFSQFSTSLLKYNLCLLGEGLRQSSMETETSPNTCCINFTCICFM